ncbi:MAG: MaoC/PaaZ C-terminal domain-containing protein [Pseudomonadota bacterium]|nr:MaoC/PaaZ C-terminal domain-containing protein [Pseudomonadota bacterium]
MTEPLVYTSNPPALLPMYGRVLTARRPKTGPDTQLPDLQAELLGVRTSGANLRTYQELCGFEPSSYLPVTSPHVLAFPLHLRLLTDRAFPLPLLGLVHLRNRITQHRPIAMGENLDLRVKLGQREMTSRGLEFDLITEARSAGQCVWEESSTTLFRMPGNAGSRSAPGAIVPLAHRQAIRAPENIGRRYAAVSGDRNPIHLHALSARAFGFPGAIAHGMWSKARCLALLEQQRDWQAGAFRVDCQFKKPLFLPGNAQLQWRFEETGADYQLLNASGDAPHLTGRIHWL